MIINSREPREIKERTPEQIYEAVVVKTFGKPFSLLRAEVLALEEYELTQPLEESEVWE